MVETKRPSIHEAKLERLKDVLCQPFWNFSVGYNSFDGISEGICIMMGIFPEGSLLTQYEYGPRFLPCGLEEFGFDVSPKGSEQLHLREAVLERADYLSQVRLAGLMPVKESMESFAKFGFHPPWLDVACSNSQYAKYIPYSLILDEDLQKVIRSKNRSAGGHARANKNQKTQLIRKVAYPIFLELQKANFQGFRAKSTGRPLATKIANEIHNRVQLEWERISKSQSQVGHDDDRQVELSLDSVIHHVRKWLKKMDQLKNG